MIARFIGPTWGASGADRTQVGPMLAPWTLLPGTPYLNLTIEKCGVCCGDSKVHGANMGPIWGRQEPGGPHVGPTNPAMWYPIFKPHHWEMWCLLWGFRTQLRVFNGIALWFQMTCMKHGYLYPMRQITCQYHMESLNITDYIQSHSGICQVIKHWHWFPHSLLIANLQMPILGGFDITIN